MHIDRRNFIGGMLAATVAGRAGSAGAQETAAGIQFGICSSPEKAAALKAAGFDFIECGVGSALKPDKPDEAFAPELEKLRACALPVRSCNGFIPASFRLTGPEAKHEPALDYAVVACRRADAAGIPHIVFGSGGARKVPAGFDPVQAREQFIDFCRKLGGRIAELKVTIVLEPLNKGETNLLNSVAEGIGYVDAINHPRIQLLADFYHMLKENEGPDSIRKAGARLRHCHVAELEGRKAPGTKGEDFRGFFAALREIGYRGGVSCEAGWPSSNLDAAWRKAVDTLRSQAAG